MTYRGHIKNGVAVLEPPAAIPDGTPVRVEVDAAPMEFYSNRTVEDLATEQGVQTVENLNDLAPAWPADDSIDEFLSLVREARQ